MTTIGRLSISLVLLACAALCACRRRPAAESAATGELAACPPGVGMISSGETGDGRTNAVAGRGGYWWTMADQAGSSIEPGATSGGGTFTMTPGGANGTKFAARMDGRTADGRLVFAGMGLNFTDPRGAYDASKFGGLSFWAKRGAGSTGRVRLHVPDKNTDPEGHVCAECFNDFGLDLQLGERWTRYTVPFSALRQVDGWGSPRPAHVDPSAIYSLRWQVVEPGVAFDIWVDEVQLTGCR